MSDVKIADILSGDGFRPVRSGLIRAAAGESCIRAAADPRRLRLEVEAGVHLSLAILHTEARECTVELEIGEGASVEVADIFLCHSFESVVVRQQAGSRCTFTVAELGGGNASYRAELKGAEAEWCFNGVFVGTDSDRCSIALDTRHETAECRSASMVKGVVSGRAAGDFRGLVYVAPDAQRTDARQQSRNIELSSDAHIVVQPQLEIYADDVKCSHGATVGHRDEEALFYMRQRGLSEREAERLQIEGFVKDITMHCFGDSLREALEGAIDDKLSKL